MQVTTCKNVIKRIPNQNDVFSGITCHNTNYHKHKVMGSIPNEVIEFFNKRNFSSHTMGLGSTHPLTEVSIRNLPGVKGWPA
jgi:hypothetical protein